MISDTRMLGGDSRRAVADRIDVAPAALLLDFAGRSSSAELRRVLHRSNPALPVLVAVPAWFGMADRQQLACYLDPDRSWKLTMVSATLAAVHGHHLGNPDLPSARTVVCLDVRHGWSAGLIHVEPGRLTEVASWGAGPAESDGVDDEHSSRALVEHLAAEVGAVTGVASATAILVMSDVDDSAIRVPRLLAEADRAFAGCEVFVENGRQLVARGAPLMRRSEGVQLSVGALPRALAVLAEDDPRRQAMQVIVAQHARFPSSVRVTFDLGPSDGAPLHFDVFEQDRSASGEIDNRVVLRATLVRERGYDRSMVVTFDLGQDGMFTIGPAPAWHLEWHPGSLDLETSP